jgi:lipoprotein-anchoring transpeptidase ErfK/SrfK
MQSRLLSIVFLSALLISGASAGQRMSGDPRIDAQWEGIGRGAVQAPVDPHTSPTRGIFRTIFGPGEMQAAPPAAAPRQQGRTSRAPSRQTDPAYLPAIVDYPTNERPGTIVIDTHNRYLYLVLEGGQAQRYGVGVGREGFGWSGRVKVGRKAEWPTWTPPAEMRRRQPYLPVSMPGGPDNPLGARALYLHDGGRDTLYRIHGSNEPWTIGHAVSSGCIRMRNEDVIELYNRVPIGANVVVM